MPGPGLMWMANRAHLGEQGFCVTFVEGAGEREVFLAFGADPEDASPRARGELGPPEEFVHVGSSGDWRVAVELTSRMGTRPEVLSRISVSGQAVVLRKAAAKPIVQFAHAVNGEVQAAVNSLAPDSWSGSDPARCQAMAGERGFGRNPGQGTGLDDLRAVLALAEWRFLLSLDPSALDGTWPAAPILPRLAELPLRHWDGPPRFGDPVADQLLSRASANDLAAVVAARTGRLLTEAHLEAYPALLTAVRSALVGPAQPVHDEDPVGFALRKISWLGEQAGTYRANPSADPPWGPAPAAEPELRHRQSLRSLVPVLRLVLAHRFSDALIADYFGLQWQWSQSGGLEQLRADLGRVIR
jgi:Family of unknown function (DUF6461)